MDFGGQDWLGPLGVLLAHGGTWYAGGGAQPPPGGPEPAHVLALDAEPFEGSDALGDHRGLRLRWSGAPVAFETHVRAYAGRPLLVFRTLLPDGARDLGTGAYASPGATGPSFFPTRRPPADTPDGLRSFAHQVAEFAIPGTGDAFARGFFMAPHRPRAVTPLLWLVPDGRALLLAPLDAFHEQTIAIPEDPEHGVHCGLHGDLREVPPGFASELAVWAGDTGARDLLEDWGAWLLERHRTRRPSRYADVPTGWLSYWTDNGAAYYYRTAPGLDYAQTLERMVRELHAARIPIRSVQIDSWFYPHENPRAVSEEGAPVVPPSGMLEWEPRSDLFPDGLEGLRDRLGGLPLAFHSRHFSRRSRYFEGFPAWHDEAYAHPSTAELPEHMLARAADWGAALYEQDWMVESFLGVCGLREAPGRARAWQEALDYAAGENALSLQWCMATPQDLLQTLSLRHVTSVRTSGDYKYIFDNGMNWSWFLYGNTLARALGLNPYKDVFLSHPPLREGAPGDPYAEVEALLAALSAGPVGIGDELGQSVREVVMRCCREDGVLVKPDLPVAALARCYLENTFFAPAPLVGETRSRHPAGDWIYLPSFNAFKDRQTLDVRVALADLGRQRPPGPVVAWDWRQRTWQRLEPDGGFDLRLGFQEWDYRVLCPLLPGERAVFGDVGKYVTAGDKRVGRIRAEARRISFDALGAPGTTVDVDGLSPDRPARGVVWSPGGSRELPEAAGAGSEGFTWDAGSGRFTLRVDVGSRGRARVELAFS